MKTEVYNLKNEKVGEIDLSDKIFARSWNADLVHQALLAQVANRHSSWAHTKGRGEVRGGGRKPWKQKHTGRARHGSIRSPIWRGGGVVHGPVKSRNYNQNINKKMLRGAIHSVLSKRLADGELRIMDSLVLANPKTKELFSALKSFFALKPRQQPNALLVPSADNQMVIRAVRNLPKSRAVKPSDLNVELLLKHKNVLIEQGAVSEIK